MTEDYANLEFAARALPAEERAHLVDVLLESLREGKVAEVEAGWKIEIAHRVAAYDAGKATLVPAEDVFANAKRIISGLCK